MSNCRKAALEYASRGWQVFPAHWITPKGKCSCNTNCGSPGKHPLTEHGLKDASSDRQIIDRWWIRYPEANVGIRTGRESKLIVLDVDSPKGGTESLKQITSKFGNIPITLSVNTGGGGKHFFFEHPCNGTDYKNATKLQGYVGIDLRGDGGYVIAAPSNHISGELYSWERYRGIPLARLPEWLDAFIRKEQQKPWQPRDAVSYWASLWNGVERGERNDALARLAGRLLGRGIQEEEALQILGLWNQRNPEPLSEREILQTVRSIGRAEDNKPQAIGCMPAEMFLTQEVVRPPEIVKNGVFVEGSGLLLIGESGVGKSLLTLEMAIRLSKGLPLWDMEVTQPYKVLFIQKENPEYTVQTRIKRICKGLNIIGLSNVFLADRKTKLNLTKTTDLRNIVKLIESVQAQIVVLDPLSSYHRVNENDNIAMRGVLDNLTEISAETGCAWIVVHHEGKPGEGVDNRWRFRGASSIRDWADTMLGYQHKPNENRILRTLSFNKIRHGPDRRGLVLERDANFIHSVYYEDSNDVPPMVVVVDALNELHGFGTKAQVVKAVMALHGCSRATGYRIVEAAQDIVWRLTDSGGLKLI